MIFGKKKKTKALQQTKTDVIVQTQQDEQVVEQPKKKGFVTRAMEGVKTTATQVQQKAQKTVDKFRKLKMFLNVVTTLFFIGNSLYWVFSKWGDFGNLLWVMLGVTAAYILVFVISLVKHRNNQKQMSMDNKKFKVQLKLWRTLANLLFIAMSGLSLVQNLMAWRIDGDVMLLISTLFSGLVLFVKLISTLAKIIKLNKKRKKLNKKQRKYDAKQQKIHSQQLHESNEQ